MRARQRYLMRGVLRGLLVMLALAACAGAPRIRPLTGVPADASVPRASIPPGHHTIVFRWEFSDRLFSARGDGVARVAPPDSIRLDFFADGGMGGGSAIVQGDSIYTPAGDQARRYLPPVPLLFAAFGALRLKGADTTIRVDGDTLRADIVDTLSAAPPATFWRVAFLGRDLKRLERIVDGRLVEQVERPDSTRVSYRNHGARRSLGLTIQRKTRGSSFDPAIWQH